MITPENVTTMKNWPTPTNVKEIESCLGFANYHRSHVEYFAEIVDPLHQLTCWLPNYQETFGKLKRSIRCYNVKSPRT